MQPYLQLRSSDNVHEPHPFNFYSFACHIHPLGSLRAGAIFRDDPEMVSLFHDAESVCTYINLNPFCKTNLPSSAEKAEQIKAIVQGFLRPTGEPIPETISDGEVESLEKNVQAFETILNDELGKLPIFCLEDEKIGNFSIRKLLNGASGGYPEKVKNRLTALCKREVDEAGKCLVYERSTAAGFHILRAVELTIKRYLEAIPRFQMPPLNRQNWESIWLS